MGAGQGKNKRTQSRHWSEDRGTASPAKALGTTARWQKFVSEQDLDEVSASEYYGRDFKSVDDVVVACHELLLDMAQIGMISFPKGATVDGLEVKKKVEKLKPKRNMGASGGVQVQNTIVLETRNPRALVRKVVIDNSPEDFINNEVEMGSAMFSTLVHRLSEAVEQMFPSP